MMLLYTHFRVATVSTHVLVTFLLLFKIDNLLLFKWYKEQISFPRLSSSEKS